MLLYQSLKYCKPSTVVTGNSIVSDPMEHQQTWGEAVHRKRVTYSPSWGTSYHASGHTNDQEIQPPGVHTQEGNNRDNVLVQPCII